MFSDKLNKIWNTFSDKEKEEINANFHQMKLEYMTLQELRKHRSITQEDIAKLLDINQANISRLENREDIKVSTIQDFVEALGGKLEIKAIFQDESIPITVQKI